MKKSVLIIVALMLLIFVGSMLLLRFYRLDLVQTVVVNAVIQKAPENYPGQRVQEVFQAARRRAEGENQEQAYLERLLRISQRLEKIQQLGSSDLDELLESLDPDEREIL
jgi:cell shape-determining protein MreC